MNIIIKNNIFAEISNRDIYSYDSTLVIERNLYEATPRITGSADSNPITGNPYFVNPANNDFHIKSDSAAKGVGLTLSDVTDDYDTVPRPQTHAPTGDIGYDIGAYEFIVNQPKNLKFTTN